MSFPINVGIPAAGNDPADDQPLMQQNFANISNFLTVDHVSAGSIGNGFHQQVTYFTENVPASLPLDTTSIGFTANARTVTGVMTAGKAVGSASPVAQEFYANANNVFPISSVRAFAYVTTPSTLSNSFNVTSITKVGTGVYNVVLSSGSVLINTFSVIVSASLASGNINVIANASITGVGTFTLNFTSFNVANDPINFSFIVLQI